MQERAPRVRALRRRWGAALLASVLAVTVAGCAPPATVHITLPARSAVDDPLTARITGLPRRTVVQVAAEATDDTGTRWRSAARFASSEQGAVSLAQRSLGGDYIGADGSGLLESMRPGSAADTVFQVPEAGYDLRLAVSLGGRTVATATTHRDAPTASGVSARLLSVADDGVHGTLFLPPAGTPRAPALLMFGGSGGGEEYDGVAVQIAAHGFPVLSLAYFAAADLPPTLDRIPLEYFVHALRLLQRRPEVDPDHLVVLGASRGSEAALLLGIHEPQLVAAVIAVDPTDHANVASPSGIGPAWTLDGAVGTPAPVTDIGIADPADAAGSVFDVARIRGPLLTLCGEGDQVWPSCAFAATLRSRRGPARVGDGFVTYAGAGHGLGVLESIVPRTVQPWGGGDAVVGGTVAGDEAAITRAHSAILRFLARQER